jgi:hypothetical protein
MNAPPVIEGITLVPPHPTVESEITARISGSDKDGDPITFKIQWFVNGKVIGEGLTLISDNIKKGDTIYAEVSPFDGAAWGSSMKSNEVTVGNVPPRILSLISQPESLFATTPRVELRAVFEDPDDDPVSLVVYWHVNNRAIQDTSSILVLEKLKPKKHDRITGTVFASDNTSRSEPFTLNLVISNSAPIIAAAVDSLTCHPDSLYYVLHITDPDGDPLTFELLQAPDGIKLDPHQGIIAGSAGNASALSIVVRAIDSENAFLDAKFILRAPF